SASKIPPTERDRYFRYQTVQGHVHDMGAAMLGGVSGHAGLFSNAQDLAALMQMLLNKGYYGGERFLEEETVEQFTKRCPDCLRRGIGFDMKQLDPDIVLNMSSLASDRTFGHLGFTGTCVWVDPDEELIYIFLSNRTYPSMKNNKLGKLNTRPLIHRAIYEAID
ncbi:MAG: serine hydrolase, partial [Bacteroidota bacterium]